MFHRDNFIKSDLAYMVFLLSLDIDVIGRPRCFTVSATKRPHPPSQALYFSYHPLCVSPLLLKSFRFGAIKHLSCSSVAVHTLEHPGITQGSRSKFSEKTIKALAPILAPEELTALDERLSGILAHFSMHNEAGAGVLVHTILRSMMRAAAACDSIDVAIFPKLRLGGHASKDTGYQVFLAGIVDYANLLVNRT